MLYSDKTDYLAHYGVLGMKWGVRRYQNPDGSLTEEGRRRAGYQYARVMDEYKSMKNGDGGKWTKEELAEFKKEIDDDFKSDFEGGLTDEDVADGRRRLARNRAIRGMILNSIFRGGVVPTVATAAATVSPILGAVATIPLTMASMKLAERNTANIATATENSSGSIGRLVNDIASDPFSSSLVTGFAGYRTGATGVASSLLVAAGGTFIDNILL